METPKKLISIVLASVLAVSAAFFFWPKSATSTKEGPPSFHVSTNKFKGSISSDTGLHAFTDADVSAFQAPSGTNAGDRHELKQGFHFYYADTALSINDILGYIEPTTDNQILIGNYSSATDNETAHLFSVWPSLTAAPGQDLIDNPSSYSIPGGQAFFIVSLQQGHIWKIHEETDQASIYFDISTVANNWILMALPSESDFQTQVNNNKSKIDSVWLQDATGNDTHFTQATDLSAIHYLNDYNIAWVRMVPQVSTQALTAAQQSITAVSTLAVSSVKLTWTDTNPQNAVYYQIYRSTQPFNFSSTNLPDPTLKIKELFVKDEKDANTATTIKDYLFFDATAAASTKYYYLVLGKNADNTLTSYSQESSISTLTLENQCNAVCPIACTKTPNKDTFTCSLINPPDNLKKISSTLDAKANISISWDKPKDIPATAVTGYYLQYGKGTKPAENTIKTVDQIAPAATGSTTYDMTNLDPDTNYWVLVLAKYTTGQSFPATLSNLKTAAATSQPVASTITLNSPISANGQITLSWTVSNQTGINLYDIFRSKTPNIDTNEDNYITHNPPGKLLDTVTMIPTAQSYSYPDKYALESGQTYYYVVVSKAKDATTGLYKDVSKSEEKSEQFIVEDEGPAVSNAVSQILITNIELSDFIGQSSKKTATFHYEINNVKLENINKLTWYWDDDSDDTELTKSSIHIPPDPVTHTYKPVKKYYPHAKIETIYNLIHGYIDTDDEGVGKHTIKFDEPTVQTTPITNPKPVPVVFDPITVTDWSKFTWQNPNPSTDANGQPLKYNYRWKVVAGTGYDASSFDYEKTKVSIDTDWNKKVYVDASGHMTGQTVYNGYVSDGPGKEPIPVDTLKQVSYFIQILQMNGVYGGVNDESKCVDDGLWRCKYLFFDALHYLEGDFTLGVQVGDGTTPSDWALATFHLNKQ